MKKLLAILWLCFIWVTYAQDWDSSDTWANPDSTTIYNHSCQCLYQPEVFNLAHSGIIIMLMMSILLFPLRKAFKKVWQKPRYSIIPLRNVYILFKINGHKILRKIFVWICILMLFFVIFWDSIQYYFYEWSNGCCTHLTGINILLRVSFFASVLLLFFQLYCLARKFGLKKINSILFSLFFPVWVRILSFGNYEYIWNKENDNNLESK